MKLSEIPPTRRFMLTLNELEASALLHALKRQTLSHSDHREIEDLIEQLQTELNTNQPP